MNFLTSVLWKLTGDPELFVEAMQYALLGVWQHTGKLKGPKAQSYIYRIALTASSQAWRNRIGRNGQIDPEVMNLNSGTEDKADRDELVARVRMTIAQLPAKQSRAIVMRYLEQQDYQTIAQSFGCSAETARSHVSKAIAALKTKLAKLAKEG